MEVFICSKNKAEKDCYKLFNVATVNVDLHDNYGGDGYVVEFNTSNIDFCVATRNFYKDKNEAETEYNNLVKQVHESANISIKCDYIIPKDVVTKVKIEQ